jgi:hypothetical protein
MGSEEQLAAVQSNEFNALYNLNGVPLFTYGMIALTTFVLAYVTMLDDSNKSFAKDEGFQSTLTPGKEGSTEKSAEAKAEPVEGTPINSIIPEAEPVEEPTSTTTSGGRTKHRKTKQNLIKYKHNKSKKIY